MCLMCQCECSAYGRQKGALDLLELELRYLTWDRHPHSGPQQVLSTTQPFHQAPSFLLIFKIWGLERWLNR